MAREFAVPYGPKPEVPFLAVHEASNLRVPETRVNLLLSS